MDTTANVPPRGPDAEPTTVSRANQDSVQRQGLQRVRRQLVPSSTSPQACTRIMASNGASNNNAPSNHKEFLDSVASNLEKKKAPRAWVTADSPKSHQEKVKAEDGSLKSFKRVTEDYQNAYIKKATEIADWRRDNNKEPESNDPSNKRRTPQKLVGMCMQNHMKRVAPLLAAKCREIEQMPAAQLKQVSREVRLLEEFSKHNKVSIIVDCGGGKTLIDTNLKIETLWPFWQKLLTEQLAVDFPWAFELMQTAPRTVTLTVECNHKKESMKEGLDPLYRLDARELAKHNIAPRESTGLQRISGLTNKDHRIFANRTYDMKGPFDHVQHAQSWNVYSTVQKFVSECGEKTTKAGDVLAPVLRVGDHFFKTCEEGHNLPSPVSDSDAKNAWKKIWSASPTSFFALVTATPWGTWIEDGYETEPGQWVVPHKLVEWCYGDLLVDRDVCVLDYMPTVIDQDFKDSGKYTQHANVNPANLTAEQTEECLAMRLSPDYWKMNLINDVEVFNKLIDDDGGVAWQGIVMTPQTRPDVTEGEEGKANRERKEANPHEDAARYPEEMCEVLRKLIDERDLRYAGTGEKLQCDYVSHTRTDAENEKALADYKAGKIHILFGDRMLTTGLDHVLIKVVFNYREFKLESSASMRRMWQSFSRAGRAALKKDGFVTELATTNGWLDAWQAYKTRMSTPGADGKVPHERALIVDRQINFENLDLFKAVLRKVKADAALTVLPATTIQQAQRDRTGIVSTFGVTAAQAVAAQAQAAQAQAQPVLVVDPAEKKRKKEEAKRKKREEAEAERKAKEKEVADILAQKQAQSKALNRKSSFAEAEFVATLVLESGTDEKLVKAAVKNVEYEMSNTYELLWREDSESEWNVAEALDVDMRAEAVTVTAKYLTGMTEVCIRATESGVTMDSDEYELGTVEDVAVQFERLLVKATRRRETAALAKKNVAAWVPLDDDELSNYSTAEKQFEAKIKGPRPDDALRELAVHAIACTGLADDRSMAAQLAVFADREPKVVKAIQNCRIKLHKNKEMHWALTAAALKAKMDADADIQKQALQFPNIPTSHQMLSVVGVDGDKYKAGTDCKHPQAISCTVEGILTQCGDRYAKLMGVLNGMIAAANGSMQLARRIKSKPTTPPTFTLGGGDVPDEEKETEWDDSEEDEDDPVSPTGRQLPDRRARPPGRGNLDDWMRRMGAGMPPATRCPGGVLPGETEVRGTHQKKRKADEKGEDEGEESDEYAELSDEEDEEWEGSGEESEGEGEGEDSGEESEEWEDEDDESYADEGPSTKRVGKVVRASDAESVDTEATKKTGTGRTITSIPRFSIADTGVFDAAYSTTIVGAATGGGTLAQAAVAKMPGKAELYKTSQNAQGKLSVTAHQEAISHGPRQTSYWNPQAVQKRKRDAAAAAAAKKAKIDLDENPHWKQCGKDEANNPILHVTDAENVKFNIFIESARATLADPNQTVSPDTLDNYKSDLDRYVFNNPNAPWLLRAAKFQPEGADDWNKFVKGQLFHSSDSIDKSTIENTSSALKYALHRLAGHCRLRQFIAQLTF